MKKTLAIVKRVAEVVVTALSLIGMVNLVVLTLMRFGIKVPEVFQTNIWGKPIVQSAVSWNLLIVGFLMVIILSKKYGWWSLGCIVMSVVLIIGWESLRTGVFFGAAFVTFLYFLLTFLYGFPGFKKLL